jgi:RNA polymerase sigma-70 factor (family 1)
MPDQQDDLQEYEQLFRSTYPQLCKRAQRITGNLETAEDIVQEVFVDFWNNETRQAINTPEAFLYSAVINKALNYATGQKRRMELNVHYLQSQSVATSIPDQAIQYQELQQQVQQTIDALPPMCQKVFLLSRHEEMSHKEIATFLNISTNTVDNHIKKALSILRKSLLSTLLVLTEIYFNFLS